MNETNYQLIKDKIYLLEKTWTVNKSAAVDNDWPNGATERDLGDRNAVPGHQGGAVVPDVKTLDEEIRPGLIQVDDHEKHLDDVDGDADVLLLLEEEEGAGLGATTETKRNEIVLSQELEKMRK